MRRGPALVAAVVLLLTACSGSPSSPGRPAGGACGPIAYGDVRGDRPSCAGDRLDRFTGDSAMCAGRWLPGADAGFVAQGLALGRGSAWVVGYDGTRPVGHRTCTVERVSLRTGALQARTRLITAAGRTCHHGGGLARTRHGLWLVETHRLWLLSPRTLAVRRVWEVPAPVRGSYLVTGARGRLGIGAFEDGSAGRLYWFPIVASMGRSRLTAASATRRTAAPANAQGATLTRSGLLTSRSTTRCGVLSTPAGDRALLPGAEGLQARGDRLWAVSEAASKGYQASGDRPLVPMLARFSLRELLRGPAPACTP